MRQTLSILILACPSSLIYADADPTLVFSSGQKCPDGRLGVQKDLNGYFPFATPETVADWNARARSLREQMLVAAGLWPMPEKTPLNPVIYGAIQRPGYTVEKVFFASMPGHFVSGNLYRPKLESGARRPAILSPHGHWKNGRFFEASEAEVKKQLASKAESTEEGARYPLQARCAQLARMGFVVFHYDMVGYADSQAIPHREGFTDAEAELRSQSFLGLQTWNSIRALDFLTSLADVDPKRIGMTGASGGGSQTLILGGIDDRIAAAFPAVMVSTAMQGGCVCENCSHLRVNTGNVEFAALMAPKPLAMSAARDWTIDLERKGLPELKRLYTLFRAEDLVAARCWPEFEHNYNQHAREFMYDWFGRHLLDRKNTNKEEPFEPIPPKELAVYDESHPRPKEELKAAELRQQMTTAAQKQLAALTPRDEKSLEDFRRVVGTALRVMVHDSLPKPAQVELKTKSVKEIQVDGLKVHQAIIGRKDTGEAVPIIGVVGPEFDGTIVLWVHPQGKSSLFKNGQLTPPARAIIDNHGGIMAADLFQTGELMSTSPLRVDSKFAGFTYGYNPSVLAQRVHDLLGAMQFARSHPHCKKLYLVGWEEAGPWAVLARALAGDIIEKTAVDLNRFRFENIKSTGDEMMLPGALKYGGLSAFIGLCAPHNVLAHNHAGTHLGAFGRTAYEAAGADQKLIRSPEKMVDLDVVGWLFKK